MIFADGVNILKYLALFFSLSSPIVTTNFNRTLVSWALYHLKIELRENER